MSALPASSALADTLIIVNIATSITSVKKNPANLFVFVFI
jgi:uncharacterized membrane protein